MFTGAVLRSGRGVRRLTAQHRTVSKFFPVENYALAETLTSGQAFRWRKVDGGWESVVHGRWVRLTEKPGGISANAIAGEQRNWAWLNEYLQLDVDLAAVIESFPNDEHLRRAAEECRGLRLLKQEPWECLASFILSSTKQIVQIQQIVALICARFGERVDAPGDAVWFSFPSVDSIAALSETELRCCKMGFRAPYLKGTAEMIVRGEVNLEAIREMDVARARSELMRFPGVGRKIADCVLLFAYGFQEAFPVDVWVLKAVRELYFPRRRPNAKKVLKFTETYFGANAGYAQQYLFHYMRTRIGRGKKDKR
ncbi:MAG TPA: DNA glycosylase [Verrucomicrobiae bacterium]